MNMPAPVKNNSPVKNTATLNNIPITPDELEQFLASAADDSQEGLSPEILSSQMTLPQPAAAQTSSLRQAPTFVAAQDAGYGMNVDLLVDVPLQITVELGRNRMTIKEILDLKQGSVVELNRTAGDPVDVFVNDHLVARGEVVVVNDNFGVRITEIISSSSSN